MEAKLIYSAIPKIMEDVGAISKNKKNQQQNFMFRGIDDVMNALYPAMTKHGVFVVPQVLESEYTQRATSKGGSMNVAVLTIKYTFYASDGSSVEAVTVGEAMDSGDKATNKAMAIALKYACFQTFMIPTEEMAADDPDGYSYKNFEQPNNVTPVYSCEICGKQVKADIAEKSKQANGGHVFCSGTCKREAGM